MDKKEIRYVQAILAIALVSLLIVSAYEVMNNGHEEKWKFTLGPSVYSDDYYSAQFVNGTVYAFHQLGNDYGIYALNPDGILKWSFDKIGGNGMSYPAISQNGTVFMGATLIGAGYPSFSAFAPNGSIIWSYQVANGSFYDTRIGPEGNVYTNHELYVFGQNSSGNDFLAFSPNGTLLWKHWSQYEASFVISNNGTVLMPQDGNLTGFSPNGSTLWKIPFYYFPGDSVQGNGAFYYVWNAGLNESGRIGIRADLVAVSPNGSKLWQYPNILENTNNLADVRCLGPPVVGNDGVVYFVRFNGTNGNGNSSLYAINPDGTQHWVYIDEYIGAPAINNGMVVAETNSGLTALDLNGHVKWKIDIGYTALYNHQAPIFGIDGTIYVVSQHGIIAIGENPIVLEIGALISLPIIAICLAVLWKAKKDKG